MIDPEKEIKLREIWLRQTSTKNSNAKEEI
jgi:hypothetical protein